jgi:hypothetical protein
MKKEPLIHKIGKHLMTAFSKEPLLVARQVSVNGNRGKEFSTGPRDTMVEGLFGEVFYM